VQSDVQADGSARDQGQRVVVSQEAQHSAQRVHPGHGGRVVAHASVPPAAVAASARFNDLPRPCTTVGGPATECCAAELVWLAVHAPCLCRLCHRLHTAGYRIVVLAEI